MDENSQKSNSSPEKEIIQRKKELFNLLKKKIYIIFYGILGLIVLLSVFIRTRNLSKLKDITTGTWTLGPDLDPFLFLRWAEYIAEHGKLFILDTMRSFPLAHICSGAACNPVNTSGEMKLLSYMIAWLSQIGELFSKDFTVTYAAIIFPVIMAALTAIAFFLFARKVFQKKGIYFANIAALISTTFFVLIPSALPRSIAGIPEKESAAFLFMFLAFYFFLESISSERLSKKIAFGILAGISTGLMSLIWGGYIFIFLTISGAMLIEFVLGKIDSGKRISYLIWLASSLAIMMPLSVRYSLINLVSSASTGIAFGILFILIFDWAVYEKDFLKLSKIASKIKIPHQILSIFLVLIIGIIFSQLLLGGSFISDAAGDITKQFAQIDQSRFSVTVAENRQPYFTSEWTSEFGPTIYNIPIYFWLFFIGAAVLFLELFNILSKKDIKKITIGYLALMLGIIFSKYSSTSVLNGSSIPSLIVYFGGVVLFFLFFGLVYYQKYREGKFAEFNKLKSEYILYFVAMIFMLVSARGAVRLIMMVGVISPLAIGYLITKIVSGCKKEKGETKKIVLIILAGIILLSAMFTLWNYYQNDKSFAESYAPSIYTYQWQKAMAWVRENTSVDSVFAHWWDYGYWVQSIGKRATILDGGNAIGYWNHLMGRLILTGSDEKAALEFLYSHNATNLLIDSTEIGKYGAFSSIGSDANYDRYSWIPTSFMDESQTQETSNETAYVYQIGTLTDEDIVINSDGKEILLPRKKAAVGAVILRESKTKEILQPKIIFIYNNKQYQEDMRYIYKNGKLYYFKTGINAGLFTFARLDATQTGGLKIIQDGAAFYLSNKTIDSQMTRLYLFGEKSDFFRLVHSEESILISDLNKQGAGLGEFVYYQGFQGPIKIWSINYPAGLTINPTYLQTTYPDPSVNIAKSEEYTN